MSSIFNPTYENNKKIEKYFFSSTTVQNNEFKQVLQFTEQICALKFIC